MKRYSTISMALVFGTLVLAVSTASANGKGKPSCNSSCHHHHKPGDPCQPPKNTIHPIVNNNPSGSTLNGTIVHHLPISQIQLNTSTTSLHNSPKNGPPTVTVTGGVVPRVSSEGTDPISRAFAAAVTFVGDIFSPPKERDPLYKGPVPTATVNVKTGSVTLSYPVTIVPAGPSGYGGGHH